jgi:hypothetical protein
LQVQSPEFIKNQKTKKDEIKSYNKVLKQTIREMAEKTKWGAHFKEEAMGGASLKCYLKT